MKFQLDQTTYLIKLTFPYNLPKDIQGVQKKGGIANHHLLWSLDYLFLIYLKIEIHLLVPSTKPYLSDIRELRNIFSIIGFVCS